MDLLQEEVVRGLKIDVDQLRERLHPEEKGIRQSALPPQRRM